MGNDMESNGTMNKCKGVGCLQRQWHHDYIIQNSQACAKDLYKNKSFRKSVTCLPKMYTELYAIYNIYTKRENRKYNKTFSKTPQQKVFGGKDLCQLIDLQFLLWKKWLLLTAMPILYAPKYNNTSHLSLYEFNFQDIHKYIIYIYVGYPTNIGIPSF